MTAGEARVKLLEAAIRKSVPDFKVAFKPDSRLQRFIGALLRPFNPKYMTGYITTMGSTVYWPSRESYTRNWDSTFEVLAHEYVHLVDGKSTSWFKFSYLMPVPLVALSLLSILAVLSKWWLFNLGWLAFAAPWPALWRMKWEMRGFGMSMAVELWRTGKLDPNTMTSIQSRFTGPDYYWMWPFKAGVRRRLEAMEASIHAGNVLATQTFKDVFSIVKMSDIEVIGEASKP